MGGFSYPDAFSYEAELIPEAMGAGAFGVFIVAYILVMLFAMAWSMVVYVLYSLGIYTVAQRRGIRHPWLAWVPLGNIWMLGSISDQYQYLAKGKIKNRRKVLLGLCIALLLACFVWVIGLTVSAIAGTEIAAVLWMLLGMLGVFGVAIVVLVLEYMTLYDLFQSCQPSNATLYLVLAILFNVTLPFFVFACRKKDLGMPPRKQPAPQQVVVPAVEVVVDPNVVEQVVVPTVEPVVESAADPVTEEGYANPEEFEEE